MKSILFLLSFLFAFGAQAKLLKGYNQAWLKNHYAHQWLDEFYSPKYVEELMRLNQEGDSKILRMWLYEGIGLNQFYFDEKKQTIFLKPEVLKNIRHFLQQARKHKIQINLTFLDANLYKNLLNEPVLLQFWWNVFNDKYGQLDHFYNEAVKPIYKLAAEFKDVVTQIDLVNEVNALNYFFLFEQPKASLSKFLCKLGKGSPAPVTASLGWGGAELRLFEGLLDSSCLDFYDVHFYNDTGAIPGCGEFKKLAAKGTFLQLGEFGQKSKSFNSELQAHVTKNFLKNAEKCGFKTALAWRLDDTREGDNPEARYSYLAFGTPREAYYVLRDHGRP